MSAVIQHRPERPLRDQYIRFVVDVDASAFEATGWADANMSRVTLFLNVWSGSMNLNSPDGNATPGPVHASEHSPSFFGQILIPGHSRCILPNFPRPPSCDCTSKNIQAVESVVQDAGKRLQWRHIHGADTLNFDGKILQWAADQHAGQAKGVLIPHLNFRAKMSFRTGPPPISQMLLSKRWTFMNLIGNSRGWAHMSIYTAYLAFAFLLPTETFRSARFPTLSRL